MPDTGRLAAAKRARARRETPSPRTPEVNPTESPLAWLHSRLDRDGRPMIDDAQFAAGERLRADLWLAGLTPRTTQSWSGVPHTRGAARSQPGGSASLTDTRMAARQRVNGALQAVGPELGDILIDVCGHLRGLAEIEVEHAWPKRSAKLILHKALTALARHYGMLPPANAEAMLDRRIRHWGGEGYRPTLDRWRQGQS